MMDYRRMNNILPAIIDRNLWLEGHMSWNMNIRKTWVRLVRRPFWSRMWLEHSLAH
jgi:hypothetical protein